MTTNDMKWKALRATAKAMRAGKLSRPTALELLAAQFPRSSKAQIFKALMRLTDARGTALAKKWAPGARRAGFARRRRPLSHRSRYAAFR